MNLEDYENQDGMKVWLSEREIEQLLDQFDDTERRIAVSLAVRCGLRSAEVLDVAPEHVVDTDAGTMLRVWSSAKTNKYRETPMPPNLATTIRTVGDVREKPTEDPLVDASTRTLRRWMDNATDELQETTGNPAGSSSGCMTSAERGLRRCGVPTSTRWSSVTGAAGTTWKRSSTTTEGRTRPKRSCESARK
ncbi:tyrosine-type recombinase/integrase [Haloarculaceae archaeon H-GB11]|nr:tyrosine-type recombinase/integrase [Haloarculaceae archaeon H-GB11]